MKTPKTLTFFQRVASIDRADWGDRAKIKVYRLAPLINRLVGSEHKFVTIYGEPITEEKLKIDHGSGRYRLYLNFKAPQTKDEKELDMVELDILDPAFPPKIPAGEWLDDPRNKQWAWAKPPGAGQQNGTAAPAPVDPLAHLNTFMDIQDRIEDRIRPAAAAPAAAAVAVDPWAAAEKILNMRADNPMMAILQKQMELNSAAAEAERQRNFQAQEAGREREHKLQLELMQAKMGGQGKPFLEQLLELATTDKLEPIKKVFGLFGGGGEAIGRVARTTALDLARDFISSPAFANIGQGLGMLLTSYATASHTNGNGAPPPQYPTVLNAQQPNGTIPPVEHPEQRIQRIGATITKPMLTMFMKGGAGSDWAQSMFDVYPEDYVFMAKLGPENIIERYRRFPEAWNAINYREGDFVEFIKEFCAWDPNTEEGPVPPGDGDDGIVDLEKEEAGA